MSTREIAELTGKQHAHVMRDFREVCAALEIAESSFGSGYLDANGQERIQYLLPKDLTNTLVSGYSIPMRHAIVKRWMALEAQQASTHHIPSSYREALLLAAEQQEQLELLGSQKQALEQQEQLGAWNIWQKSPRRYRISASGGFTPWPPRSPA